MTGRLVYFLPFWEEVIQANCWVLESIRQGYSIELVWTLQFQGVRSTPVPLEGLWLLSNDVEDLLR